MDSEKKLDLILEYVKDIERRLFLIETSLQINNEACEKMNTHIDFIHNTYNIVRAPLNYITNRVECIMGNSNKHVLPEIKNNGKV